MAGAQKRFYKEIGYRLELLKRMKEEAKPPPPRTTIVVGIEAEKTSDVQCPTRTASW